MSRAAFDRIAIEEWDSMMAVNRLGTWLAARGCIEHMIIVSELRTGRRASRERDPEQTSPRSLGVTKMVLSGAQRIRYPRLKDWGEVGR
jgi:NAD(P)-dependent dehydrogenase (short-subunit alcohol dehydrogenase family)